ncbi:hypothetical protein I203_100214 [Kwoniella mangroviensis CBS 8507]|uniref:uncharacterized protein n=1 Tax=Kwoniella mangroviensis CBS 8507 TaxID=1296122 RepID=UPI00080D7AAF|nr:uncharacterized protein I203_05914 [Kwoniella mangroviensis CBS 8507]OCF65172.1 hypothetical protein I203_05914 [Kwoniella mangroviensis CBS 8507]
MLIILNALSILGLIQSVLGTAVDPSNNQDMDKRTVTSSQLMAKEGPSYTDINTAANPLDWDILLGVQSALAVLTKLNKAAITDHIKDHGEPGTPTEKATFESTASMSGEDAFQNWWWRGSMQAVMDVLGTTYDELGETGATADTVLEILTGRKTKTILNPTKEELKYLVVMHFDGDENDSASFSSIQIVDRQWVTRSNKIEVGNGDSTLIFLEDEGPVP